MNDETILAIARGCGMIVYDGTQDRVVFDWPITVCLIKFARRIQAAERERCALIAQDMHDKACDANEYLNGYEIAAAIREQT